MIGVRAPRIEIDGETATVDQIWTADLSADGHFTAMQIRAGKTLGIDPHLIRLDSASREMFGVGLDGDRVRSCLRHALADDAEDASVRVNVFPSGDARDVSVMVSVRPPAPAPPQGKRLQSVVYRRPLAHLKRTNGFGQSYFAGLAHGNGLDEALFVGPDDAISEGSITNIGFLDGDAIVWPNAPALRGVMMQVLQRELDRANVSWRYEAVMLSDLASFGGAFLTNSHGMATVAAIDGVSLPTDTEPMRLVRRSLEAAPYDPI